MTALTRTGHRWLGHLLGWTALGLLPPLLAVRLGGSQAALAGGTAAADRALAALTGFSLPLLAMAVFASLEATGVDSTQQTFVRFGSSRRGGQIRNLLERTVGLSVVYTVLAASIVVVARTSSDPLLRVDLTATLPAALLSALCTAALFAAAKVWWGTLGLAFVLVVTWTLGHVDLPIAGLVPVGHMRHLLGLGAALPWPQWTSSLALGAMSAALASVTALGLPR